jgi:HAD superfamily hydrolase (TIGR01509 family)
MPLTLPAGDFRAFIFDCDGTLANNMHLHYEAWSRAMEDFGGTYPEELFYEWGGVPTGDIVRRLNDEFGLSLDVEEVVARKEHYYRDSIPKVEPVHEVIALAREHHGRIPMAVASGGHRDLVERTLRELAVAELFDAVVTAEDYVRGKPAPDPFLKAAELLRVEPAHCLVFEDTVTGAEAARAAGMQCVIV